MITSSQIEDGTIRNRDIAKGAISLNRLSEGTQALILRGGATGAQGTAGEKGAGGADGAKGDKGDKGLQGIRGIQGIQGIPGVEGPTGPTGPAGKDASTAVTSLTGLFEPTNPSVTMGDDGAEYGPYTDGGAAGGSVYFSGLNGKKLSDITNLYYAATYSTDDDTTVGVPYLRLFTEGDTHDVIFSPNTQPVPFTAEDVAHHWSVTSGSVRYDDDSGVGGDMSWAALIAAHGNDVISGIYVTGGFSAGQNLTVTLHALGFDALDVGPKHYDLGS